MENINKIQNIINNSFIFDIEKMQDFKILSKQDFLKSYSYINEIEYNNTCNIIEAFKNVSL